MLHARTTTLGTILRSPKSFETLIMIAHHFRIAKNALVKDMSCDSSFSLLFFFLISYIFREISCETLKFSRKIATRVS